MTLKDAIKSSIDLHHPPQAVWDAITTPEGLNQWFGDRVFSTFKVGYPITFEWDKYGTVSGTIETHEPITCFAYRWRAHGVPEETLMDKANSTLVTFKLTPTPQGTQLDVIETGFLQLAPELRNVSFRENSSGWKSELDELVALFAR